MPELPTNERTPHAIDERRPPKALSSQRLEELKRVVEEAMETAWRRGGGIPKLARTPEGRAFLTKSAAAEAAAIFLAEIAELRERERSAWLPIVLCPTDGVWRLVKLPDGSEVVAAFTGDYPGPTTRRWRKKSFGYRNPSRPTGETRGGVEQYSAPFDTFIIEMLPEGVYPTHFRPNDTVHGTAQSALKDSEQ